ncbi:inducible metalloproteinase inhibitor protein-like [Leguminivora glycinivorella]|uniref:inducible metalloproteinase inhibitor protein-like n=1 Tax=Leguminivora glycinivorella TaxID=1035111 RepID=UPI00200CCDAB|nr:inducible metalloproteinase inhibitor protein-like [Leguminivora glycinivorella]
MWGLLTLAACAAAAASAVVLSDVPTTECGINEQYSSCVNGGCGYRNCSQLGRPRRCADPAPGHCVGGCVCAAGLLRAANGSCVPQDQCEASERCEQPNEVFDPCPAACPGDSCGVEPSLVLCARAPERGDPRCVPACTCRAGYARNDHNACIPRDQCPPKN